MNTARSFLAATIAGATIAASAATTITVDSVVQRWPWNNKVDITYTIVGGQDLASGNYQKIVFTTVINGVTYTIDGVKDVGASANAGTHTVTWTLPPGVRSTSCAMSAAAYAADAPSGDDYMIIDLTKTFDNVTYEGLLATQDASNERYNTATYKTDKLVLRKIPAGGPYPTGDNAFSSGNDADSSTTWTTDRDCYIGVFPVTQYQYKKLYGSNPSSKTSTISGNTTDHRPVEQVSWDDLRLSTTASTSPIPAVASNSGTFFQRLNYITGNLYGFDLPTEVMFEIAERAGATTAYYWGNAMDTSYVVCSDNSGNSTVAVGSRLPNAWGLYDTAGNVWEWCRDDKVNGNLTTRTDAFTPAWASGSSRRYRGGGNWLNPSSSASFRASHRDGYSSSLRNLNLGFRVSRIVD
ncbi:MAG: formylglycine-generating enzyme family protein [Kiritimatiellae bacterium]|nr:formylglycine-generating enzyme family protein [Kiritimatiellia bacterium]